MEKPSFFNRCNFWYKPRTRGKYYSECYRITQILISTLIYLKNLKYTYLEVFIFLGYADDFFILTNLPEDLFFNIFIIMFSNITVVNVDGRTGDNLSTQMALLYSQSKLPGSKSLLIAPQEPKITIGNFDFAKIDPLDYSAYSIFMLYKLHNFINTEFALIIQDDGWVINEKAWSKNYFSYDYLGAPTHLARRKIGELYSYYKNYTWVKDYFISPENFDVVLNGGFSLRSKKLLELPEAKSMKFIIDPPDPNIKSSLVWSQDPLLEDVQICLQLRTQLAAYGIKFPEIEIAKKFSIEHIDINFHDKLDLMDVFGHHSKIRKICSLNPITIEYQISEENIYKLPGEIYIYQMFKKLGYRIKFSA